MNLGNPMVLAISGLFVAVAGVWVGRNFYSAAARQERRRRRSNTRIASTAKRPMVRFSVRTKNERRK